MNSGIDLYELPLNRMLNYLYYHAIDGTGIWADKEAVRKEVDQRLARADAQAEGREYDTGAADFIRLLGGNLEDIPVITYGQRPPFDPFAFKDDEGGDTPSA
jgi:hypothetical protein